MIVGSASAVDIAPVTDRDHSDEALVFFKLVDDPVWTAPR
jgi:hypothetical protein